MESTNVGHPCAAVAVCLSCQIPQQQYVRVGTCSRGNGSQKSFILDFARSCAVSCFLVEIKILRYCFSSAVWFCSFRLSPLVASFSNGTHERKLIYCQTRPPPADTLLFSFEGASEIISSVLLSVVGGIAQNQSLQVLPY